jgi:hypothetical protein
MTGVQVFEGDGVCPGPTIAQQAAAGFCERCEVIWRESKNKRTRFGQDGNKVWKEIDRVFTFARAGHLSHAAAELGEVVDALMVRGDLRSYDWLLEEICFAGSCYMVALEAKELPDWASMADRLMRENHLGRYDTIRFLKPTYDIAGDRY